MSFRISNTKTEPLVVRAAAIGELELVSGSARAIAVKNGSEDHFFVVDAANARIRYLDGNQTNGYYLTSDENGVATWAQPPDGVATATGSNVGTLGQGVFKQKTGIDLEFRHIEGGTGVTETLDANNNIVIDMDDTAVTPATYGTASAVSQVAIDQQGRITAASNVAIDHDQLTNYEAKEHIDWTNSSDDFKTSGTATLTGQLTYTGATPTDGYILSTNGSGVATWIENRQHGWANYQHSGSEQTITTTYSKLLNNGAGASSTSAYISTHVQGIAEFWDVATSKITPVSVGDSFTIRIDLGITAKSGSPNILTLQLDIGGAVTPTIVIVERFVNTAKTPPYNVSVAFPIYCLATFLANGGQLFCATDLGTLDIEARAILIVQTSFGDLLV